MGHDYLPSVIKQFEYYKSLGEKTFAQLDDDHLCWQYNNESNSIATIVKHLSGNMESRWTDLFTTDGEKAWRDRDAEFINSRSSREEITTLWTRGWTIFLDCLYKLTDDDLSKIIYIRNQGHTVLEAINRQLAHYAYHVGQIVFVGKMCAAQWSSLSIPKGNSQDYNNTKFAQAKHREHFTNEFLKNDKEER